MAWLLLTECNRADFIFPFPRRPEKGSPYSTEIFEENVATGEGGLLRTHPILARTHHPTTITQVYIQVY